MSLLSPNYKPIKVTELDMKIASLAWGFTLGFGFLTAWKVIRQTGKIRSNSDLAKPYVWMIWLELIVSAVFSVICWLHLDNVISPSFAFYFIIVTLWALQVQFLLQIIVNRVTVLLVNRRKASTIKWSIAAIITAINISVYCIWIPARLQISETYIHLNSIWDRCEKCIYLLVDVALNFYFIYIVKRRLVDQGLRKYDTLVKFNMMIVGFSLGMDVLIIATMSLRNTFVYMQFHPLAYLVKLNIEMTMAELISRVSRSPQHAFRAGALSSTDERDSRPTELTSRTKSNIPNRSNPATRTIDKDVYFSNITVGRDMPDNSYSAMDGIVKKTEVVVTRHDGGKAGSSKTSISETEAETEITAGNSEGEEDKYRYGDERPFRIKGPDIV